MLPNFSGHCLCWLGHKHALADASRELHTYSLVMVILSSEHTPNHWLSGRSGVQPHAAAHSISLSRVWASCEMLLAALAGCSIPTVIMAAHAAACKQLDRKNGCGLPIPASTKQTMDIATTGTRILVHI